METPTEKPAQTEAPSPPLSETQCHEVLIIAFAYAYRHGFRREDSEDGARDFLLHLMIHVQDHPEIDLTVVLSPAVLARSADNWMKNCCRAQIRRTTRETAWPTSADEDDPAAFDPASEDPTPDVAAVCREFHARIGAGVALLSPSHQALFTGYIKQEHSASDLAHASGKTVNAVHQAIWAMRRQLRQILLAAGLDEAEIREYLRVFREYRRPT